jgi:hypothetical protein
MKSVKLLSPLSQFISYIYLQAFPPPHVQVFDGKKGILTGNHRRTTDRATLKIIGEKLILARSVRLEDFQLKVTISKLIMNIMIVELKAYYKGLL